MSAQDGGSAFPYPPTDGSMFVQPPFSSGMSLRDYFAAQALAAMIQRLGPIVKVEGTGPLTLMPDHPAVSEEDGRQIRRAVAMVAYEYADAMVKERNNERKAG